MRKLMLIAFVATALFACKEKSGGSAPPPRPASSPPPPPPPPAAKAESIVDELTLMVFQGATIASFVEAGNKLPADLVDLGRMLFYEERLSKAHDVSCNTCHDLAGFGVDNKKLSEGHRKQLGNRNSPTVYNASMQFVQFWDGREETIETQAWGPLLDPVEMAMTEERVLNTLKSMPGYVEAFQKAFPEEAQPISRENVGKALGAFQRRLITPTRFHQFIAEAPGKTTALTTEEQRGLETFRTVGCTTCHTGPGVGGTMFQKLGAIKPWPDLKDKGRGAVTKNPAHDHEFKVPTLLNVAKTAPYGHDGKMATLEEAVRMMAEYQLELESPLTDAQVKDIVAFLNTLTGDIPTDFIQKPELPKATPRTPKPEKR